MKIEPEVERNFGGNLVGPLGERRQQRQSRITRGEPGPFPFEGRLRDGADQGQRLGADSVELVEPIGKCRAAMAGDSDGDAEWRACRRWDGPASSGASSPRPSR